MTTLSIRLPDDMAERLKSIAKVTRQEPKLVMRWFNPVTNRYTTIPNHPGDMPESTLQAILKQAGIATEDCLKNK